MKTRVAQTIFYTVTAMIGVALSSCSSSNDIVSNYYDDGIYYDSEYGGSLMAEDLGLSGQARTETSSATDQGYDYYDPTALNNNLRNSSSNQNFNSSPDINIYFGYGFGRRNFGFNPYYDPFWGSGWNDPFFSPYGWGYGPRFSYGYSWGWGFNSGWGFNNGWGSPYSYYNPWNPWDPWNRWNRWGWNNPYAYHNPYYGGGWSNNGFTPRPTTGTGGRTYYGPTPNRFNVPSRGRAIGGSGKRDLGTDRPTANNRPIVENRTASRLRQNTPDLNQPIERNSVGRRGTAGNSDNQTPDRITVRRASEGMPSREPIQREVVSRPVRMTEPNVVSRGESEPIRRPAASENTRTRPVRTAEPNRNNEGSWWDRNTRTEERTIRSNRPNNNYEPESGNRPSRVTTPERNRTPSFNREPARTERRTTPSRREPVERNVTPSPSRRSNSSGNNSRNNNNSFRRR